MMDSQNLTLAVAEVNTFYESRNKGGTIDP